MHDDDQNPDDAPLEGSGSTTEKHSTGLRADGDAAEETHSSGRSSLADAGATGEPRSLGLERWVQFAYVLLAGVTFFLADKLVTYIWGLFAEPQATVASGVAAIAGLLAGYLAYRHPKLNLLTHEVADELARVTWPSRQETSYSALVVIVTSVVAAAYIGLFDALWSAFTDLIYSTT
jgi:preprotein translocase subunit SecE